MVSSPQPMAVTGFPVTAVAMCLSCPVRPDHGTPLSRRQIVRPATWFPPVGGAVVIAVLPRLGEGTGVQDGVRDLLQGPVGAVAGPVQQLPGLRHGQVVHRHQHPGGGGDPLRPVQRDTDLPAVAWSVNRPIVRSRCTTPVACSASTPTRAT